MELPIIVEASAWRSILFGACFVIAALYLLRHAKQAKEAKVFYGSIVTALAFFAFGMVFVLQHVRWELRVDDNGIALRAPFDVWGGTGAIGWSEMAAVKIVTRTGKGGSKYYLLHVDGPGGALIEVTDVGRLPRQFVVELQKIVAARAPQAKDMGRLVDDFEVAVRNGDELLGPSYSAHGGRGQLLQ
jgi:hypothetical protein